MGWLIDGVIDWLAKAVLATLKALWGLLGGGLFVTPDVTGLPQVTAITDRSVMVVNVCFVLAVITAGVTVMTHKTVQIRYGIGEVAPRLVFGWIASNFAIPLCQGLIELANALTQALTGDGITSTGSFEQLQRVVAAALTDTSNAFLLVVMGLIIAVLTGMLMVVWLVRLGVLIVWVGVAPIALACHATPYTDGAAKLWWRTGLGTLGTVVLQALAMHAALSIFLNPNANLPALGLPHDPTGVINLFIVCCLLWVVVKIPGMMRRYVTHSGQHNVAGLFLRMVLIQQVSRLFRLPTRRGGGRAAAAAGGARAAAAGGGGSVATTVSQQDRDEGVQEQGTPGEGVGAAVGGRDVEGVDPDAGGAELDGGATDRVAQPEVFVFGVDDRDVYAVVEGAEDFQLDQVGLAGAGAGQDDGVVVVDRPAVPPHHPVGGGVEPVQHATGGHAVAGQRSGQVGGGEGEGGGDGVGVEHPAHA